jgi:hypothetical protein
MSKERPNFLDPLHDASAIVRRVDVCLQEFAEALEMTGNERLGKRLRYLSENLSKAGEFIETGSAAALDTLLNDAASASDNMIRAALAVAEARAPLSVTRPDRP